MFNWRRLTRRSETPTETATDIWTRQAFMAALGTLRADATAAFQAGIAALERAFMAAECVPDALLARDLVPVIRRLMTHGECVALFREEGGRFRLRLARSFTIEGESMDEWDWRYKVDLAAPTASGSRWMRGADVFHWRIGADGGTPWHGRAPLELCASTASILAAVELAHSRELKIPPTWFFEGKFSTMAGRERAEGEINEAILSTARDRGLPLVAIPVGHQVQDSHMRPDPSSTLNVLHARVGPEILGVLGVPPPVAGHGPDGGQAGAREAFRRFTYGTCAPLARMISQEVEAKTGRRLNIHFANLMSGDIAGRARSYKSLVESGMAPELAAHHANLDEGGAPA